MTSVNTSSGLSGIGKSVKVRMCLYEPVNKRFGFDIW